MSHSQKQLVPPPIGTPKPGPAAPVKAPIARPAQSSGSAKGAASPKTGGGSNLCAK
jgi:hypothetical protein